VIYNVIYDVRYNQHENYRFDDDVRNLETYETPTKTRSSIKIKNWNRYKLSDLSIPYYYETEISIFIHNSKITVILCCARKRAINIRDIDNRVPVLGN